MSRVTGTISQLGISGSISQKGVSSSLSQLNVTGSLSQIDITGVILQMGVSGTITESGFVPPQTNVQAALIPGGVRVTWTDAAEGTNELYGSEDEGAFALIDTIGRDIETEDDLRGGGVLMAYKMRAKL